MWSLPLQGDVMFELRLQLVEVTGTHGTGFTEMTHESIIVGPFEQEQSAYDFARPLFEACNDQLTKLG